MYSTALLFIWPQFCHRTPNNNRYLLHMIIMFDIKPEICFIKKWNIQILGGLENFCSKKMSDRISWKEVVHTSIKYV